ncbi:DoxX family protein [Leucobacter komagatae]|uniref:Membrane protein n=1 Tax=Leucobacter komagatae TaxID=55969 RepID=A0A0D0HY22_9MICO|nr:DoxX family protein [Leucobacter komagatae]KIP52471.1 membrane protein [Leucobacter komagatae]
MTFVPAPWWATALLAVVLIADAALSLRPPRFISSCLSGVGFPRDWWWTLIVIKLLAATGLLAGIWVPGVALAAHVGVIAYFGCAVAAHIRAKFFGVAFWFNCLGMLALAIGTAVLAFAAQL